VLSAAGKRCIVCRFGWLLLALGACALPGTATAQQTYKWVDDKGVVHYTDKLPTEPLNKGATVLDKQAVPIRSIEAPLTPAQRAAKEEETRRAATAAKAREDTERADRALMQSFSSEQEIMESKARAIAPLEGQIQAAQAYVNQLNTRKTDLEARKAALGNKPVPDAIERDLESIGDELGKQATLINTRRQELVQTSAHYDAFALRWNELKAAADAKTNAPPPPPTKAAAGTQ
jgi:DNA repair exonuclease SbcCD ATPase subunit